MTINDVTRPVKQLWLPNIRVYQSREDFEQREGISLAAPNFDADPKHWVDTAVLNNQAAYKPRITYANVLAVIDGGLFAVRPREDAELVRLISAVAPGLGQYEPYLDEAGLQLPKIQAITANMGYSTANSNPGGWGFKTPVPVPLRALEVGEILVYDRFLGASNAAGEMGCRDVLVAKIDDLRALAQTIPAATDSSKLDQILNLVQRLARKEGV